MAKERANIWFGKDGYNVVEEFERRTNDPAQRQKDNTADPDAEDVTWMKSKIPKGSKLLDVGCGYGRLATLLYDQYSSYVGVDIIAGRIQNAIDHHSNDKHAAFQVVPSDSFDIRDVHGLFDVAVACTVFQHLCMGDAIGLMTSTLAHLKVGSHIVIRDACFITGTGNEAIDLYETRPKHMIPKSVHDFPERLNIMWHQESDHHWIVRKMGEFKGAAY